MCFTIDQINRAFGILLLSEANTFIYCCKLCPREFVAGVELETHIRFEHDDNDRKPLESIFVNNFISDSGQSDVLQQPENKVESKFIASVENYILPDVRAENISLSDITKPADLVGTESIRKSMRMRAKLPGKAETQQRTANERENNCQTPADTVPTNSTAQFLSKIEVNEIRSSTGHDKRIQGTDRDNRDCDEKSKCQGQSSTKQVKVKQNLNHEKPHKGVVYCDMCPDVTFSTLEILKAHMKRHVVNKVRKPCPLCSIRPFNMDKHMRIAHIEAKPYKCNFCDATFRHNVGRVVHMRTHTGERPYMCETCGKSFSMQSGLRIHNMRRHGKEMPHLCNVCNRRFITPARLQEHIYSFHSSERPYSCEICGNRYSTSKYLRKHRQSHGEKIHQCKHCEKKFKTTETRRWHERTVHKAI